MKTVHIIGDIHGNIEFLNSYIKEYIPSILILLGDCGFYWVNKEGNPICNINKIDTRYTGTKIYWLPGNHENWQQIEYLHGRWGYCPVHIADSIFYCPIGSNLIINDYRIIFIGGADSIDKEHRVEGVSWFPQEVLNDQDYLFIQKANPKTSKLKTIICSHTCPEHFDMNMGFDSYRFKDPSRRILSETLKHYRPEYWFAGHWHKYHSGRYDNTFWQVLDCGDIYDYENKVSRGYLDITGVFDHDYQK
jgi:hypothetical protein